MRLFPFSLVFPLVTWPPFAHNSVTLQMIGLLQDAGYCLQRAFREVSLLHALAFPSSFPKGVLMPPLPGINGSPFQPCVLPPGGLPFPEAPYNIFPPSCLRCFPFICSSRLRPNDLSLFDVSRILTMAPIPCTTGGLCTPFHAFEEL